MSTHVASFRVRYPHRVSVPAGWAGVSREDRRARRRASIVRAAFDLFGDGGEAAVTVRSVSRTTGLHHRYFRESFANTDELLGAVYDEVYTQLRTILTAATAGVPGDQARLRAGIGAVLDFSSADARRGQILFTAAPTNPVLVARRAHAQHELREYIFRVRDRDRVGPKPPDQVTAKVAAAIYAGATAELNQQWLAGSLGNDLEAVVERAVRLLAPG